jgi:cytoskeletal protein RodZ
MPLDLVRTGEILRTAREDKGLSTQEVAEALFIRRRIIEAIEAGQRDNLPHEVYVRGYVTQYAAFLGIRDRIRAEMTSVQVEAHATTERTENLRSRTSTGANWQARRRVLWMTAVAVIGLGFLVYQNIDKQALVVPPVQEQTREQQQINEFEPPRGVYQAVAAETLADDEQTGAAVFEAKKLTISCQRRTWVRIIIDGLEKKEFMMYPEEVLVLDGKEGFDLLIGNAGGIKLFYNGKDTGFEGDEGEVKRVSFS